MLLVKTNPKESPELPIMKIRCITCIDVWSTLCLRWCRRKAFLIETKAIDRHDARSVRSRTRRKALTSACPGQGQTDSPTTTHSKFSWFPKLPGSNSQRVPWVADVPPDAGRHLLRYQSELETGSLVPNFYHGSAVWLKGPKVKCQRGHVITWLYKIYIRQVKLTRFKKRSAISFETRYNTSNTWLVFVARSFHSLLILWRRDLPNHSGGSVWSNSWYQARRMLVRHLSGIRTRDRVDECAGWRALKHRIVEEIGGKHDRWGNANLSRKKIYWWISRQATKLSHLQVHLRQPGFLYCLVGCLHLAGQPLSTI